MADLTKLNITDPTIQAMKAKIVELQDKRSRDYLGASLIGNPCSRQIWYVYNKYPKADFTAETLLRFEDGHRSEDLTAQRLRLVDGIELHTHKPDGTQYGFVDFDGKFKGHIDGLIRGLKDCPKTPHIWENKSAGYKKFNEFEKCLREYGSKQALKNWNENYYIQAQIYMHYFDMRRHYLTVGLSGGTDYLACRTEYDEATAKMAIEKARYIIEATEPPEKISEKPDFYICSWCDFKGICHNENTKAVSGSLFDCPF
jgi:hypothetical protein